MPTYAFQRRHYWLDNNLPPGAASTAEALLWQTIERDDRASLIETLDLTGDDQKGALDQVLPALAAWRRRTRALLSALPEVDSATDSVDDMGYEVDTGGESLRTRLAECSDSADQRVLLLARIRAILAVLLNQPSADEVASDKRFRSWVIRSSRFRCVSN
ncbi:hypothetical protein ACQPW1_11135 [Nocardia sp. CA-128927]|uniref:hypothetical protein n=1 Tax=Nocardia sp. CA-128927 TaxID=3239975 RepID=UPI003D964734